MVGSRTCYLVVGVVHQRGLPLALVLRVVDDGPLPLSAARRRLAGGVSHLRSLPLSVHVLVPAHSAGEQCSRCSRCTLSFLGLSRTWSSCVFVPVFWLLRTRVGDKLGLIVQPALGFQSVWVFNLCGSVFVPETHRWPSWVTKTCLSTELTINGRLILTSRQA